MAKVLCVQPLPGIGDILWFLPHMRAIAAKTPGGKITLLTKKSTQAQSLLAQEKWLEDIIWLERDRRDNAPRTQRHAGFLGRWNLGQDLKSHNFSQGWILHHSNFYAHSLWLAGVPERIGFKGDMLTQKFPLNAEEKQYHPREQVTAFLKNAGLDIRPYEKPLLFSKNAQKNIQGMFGTLSPDKKRILLGVGASEVKKMWPQKHFAELLKMFNTPEYQLILCGGAAEEKIIGDVQKACPGVDLQAAIGLDFQEVLALCASSHLYIGNDTGLMNLMVNQEKPCVVVFGPTRTLYSPLIHPLISENATLDAVTPDMVFAKVNRVI